LTLEIVTLYVLCIISSTLSVVGIFSDYYIDAYAQESNQNQTMTLALRTLVQNGSPFIGNLSAPITVIDFSDFQCYLCNRYVQNTEP
jgi:protein-disulfide isomerase